jgi:hypothetical protein
MKADHASAAASSRQPGRSLNVPARKVTPGAAAIAAAEGAIPAAGAGPLLAGGSAAADLGLGVGVGDGAGAVGVDALGAGL